MSFGEQLQLLRRGHGLTQEEFAQQLKVSRQAVSKWESSRGYPEMEKIIYICNLYGVTMDELFREEVPLGGGGQRPQEDREESVHPLKAPPLRKAFGDFFTNLSPDNQKLFRVGAAALVLLVLVLFCITVSKGGSNQVIAKIIWLTLVILFGIGEAVSVGLTSIWFAAGSLAALGVAMLGGPEWLQIILFLLVSALCLWAVRPLARKYLTPSHQPTNADRVIGTEAVVTQEINNLAAQGAVTVSGMTWSARSVHDDVIPAGTVVRVERIEGVKLFVTQSKEKEEVKC